MALNTNPTPFGLSDVKLTSIDGATQVDLPASMKFTWKERIESAEGKGDDKLSSVVSVPVAVEWELSGTGLPLEAYALMKGISTNTSGSTPNQIKTLTTHGGVRLPYFLIYGKSLGEGDDDVHVKMFKCKVTEGLDAPFEYGKLAEYSIKGLAIDDDVNGIYEVVQNETADDLPGTFASPPSFTLSSSPADAATGVSVSANVVLTFSNALRAGAENGIMLTSDAGAPVACARTIDAARKVVTLDPNSNLSGSTKYLVIVPGVMDKYGQSLANTVVDFTTA